MRGVRLLLRAKIAQWKRAAGPLFTKNRAVSLSNTGVRQFDIRILSKSPGKVGMNIAPNQKHRINHFCVTTYFV